jgi:PAS domain S-box-containing protein
MAEKKSSETARTLQQKVNYLEDRLAEAEETIRALRSGEVDALVIYGPAGPSIYTLQGADRAYRIIVENMTEGAVTTTLEGTVLYGNPSLGEVLGVPGGAVMGKSLSQFVHIDERQRFADFLEQARTASVRGRFLLAVTGRSRAYFSTAILRQEGEEPRLCMVVTDLTELEAATDQLRKAQAEKEIIQGSEERFRLLANVIPQIVWSARPDGGMDFLNTKWSEFSGVSQKKGLGWGWSATIHPDDLESTQTAWQRAVAEGKPYEMEHRFRRADGVYRWVLSRALPLLDEKSRVLRWFGTATDITDLRDAQHTLQKTIEELARSNQELEQFAYIASHDLQTPLRTVSNFVDLLVRRFRGKLGPQADEYIFHISDGVQQMHQLVNDVLDYSRVTTRGGRFKTTDCQKVLAQVLSSLHTLINENHAIVTSGELPVVDADEGQLLRVFQNLLSNAIKFRKKHEPLRLHITAEEKQGAWEFRFTDNGIGIEPQYFERIFQIFQRLHTRKNYPGTGIGLALCKRIVERHGGRIWVESTPGQGSTFLFTLPSERRHEL